MCVCVCVYVCMYVYNILVYYYFGVLYTLEPFALFFDFMVIGLAAPLRTHNVVLPMETTKYNLCEP